MFSNPVAQPYIRPFGSPSIIGNFRVTAPFGAIDASHPTPHNGVDIGNGKCGEPLLALATGKITMNEYLDGPLGPNTVLVVRGIGDATPNYEWAIAHCASVSVKVGQRVTVGQTIGVLGSTGTTACHAHLGCKQLIAGKWTSIDIWPLLDQNEDHVSTISQQPIPLTGWSTKGGLLTAYKLGSPPKAMSFPAGSSASANAIVSKVDPLPAGWPQGPYLAVANGAFAGYLVVQSAVNFTAPDPCAPLKADLDKANAKLDAIKKVIA